MREILADLDLLTEGALDLPSLQLDGVAFGAEVETGTQLVLTN